MLSDALLHGSSFEGWTDVGEWLKDKGLGSTEQLYEQGLF